MSDDPVGGVNPGSGPDGCAGVGDAAGGRCQEESPADDGAGTLCGVGFASAMVVYCLASGFTALAALTVAWCLGALGVGDLLAWARGRTGDAASPGWPLKLALVGLGVGLGFVAVEAGLALLACAGARQPGGPPRWLTDLAFPPEWRMRSARVSGAPGSFYWHGKLHLQNPDGLRVAGSYQLDEGAFRIVALGDGFTYGYGVEAEEAYPAVLERSLAGHGRVRVYNLGVPGFSSGDYVRLAGQAVAPLQPHLVILGLCLDDLDMCRPRNRDDTSWRLPLPGFLIAPFAEETRTGRLWSSGFDRLLRLAGLRDDFLPHAMRTFDARLARLRVELVEINRRCVDLMGLPVLAMVLDERPGEFDCDRSRLVRLVERAASDAQMDVLPSEPFRRDHAAGRVLLTVSRWEGHPNALAHRLWGEILADAVEEHPRFNRWLANR